MPTSSVASRAGSNCRIDRGPRGGVSTNAATPANTIAKTTTRRERQRITLPPALLAQLFLIGLLGSFDEPPVAVGVDERIRRAAGPRRLRLEIEHAAVLGDEDVRLQIVQHAEGAGVVIGDRRDPRVADQMHSVVDRDAAHEGHLIASTVLRRVHQSRWCSLAYGRA